MNPLGGFFEKFLRITAERDDMKRQFIESAVVCGIIITERDFSIKENIATIKGSAALRNTIFMAKDRILSEFNKRTPRRLDIIN